MRDANYFSIRSSRCKHFEGKDFLHTYEEDHEHKTDLQPFTNFQMRDLSRMHKSSHPRQSDYYNFHNINKNYYLKPNNRGGLRYQKKDLQNIVSHLVIYNILWQRSKHCLFCIYWEIHFCLIIITFYIGTYVVLLFLTNLLLTSNTS